MHAKVLFKTDCINPPRNTELAIHHKKGTPMKDMDPTMAAILLGAGVAIFVVFGFSRYIGSNFQVTLAAAAKYPSS